MVVRSKDIGDLVAKGVEGHGLYRLSTLLVHRDMSRFLLWHERFGYVNYDTLLEIAKTLMVDGLQSMVAP